MDAIRAEGISKCFGAGDTLVCALRDVFLRLESGTVVALLGPSGSGKSTLVKALGLVSLPDQGHIWMQDQLVVENGRATMSLRELRRRHLGFVFQKANLIPFMTAIENVAIAAEIGGDPEPFGRARELLEYLEVSHREHAMPDTLSGGEQQRVAIARALANRPAIVLADEPTAALDKARGRAVMELFRRVAHEQQSAVLVVTHDHRTLDVFDVRHELEDGQLKD